MAVRKRRCIRLPTRQPTLVQRTSETPNGKYYRVQHMQILTAGDVAIDQVAIVSIPVAKQVFHELLRRSVGPVIDVEIGWLGEIVWQQLASQSFHIRVKPNDVVAVCLLIGGASSGRTAVEQKHGLEIFLERMNR